MGITDFSKVFKPEVFNLNKLRDKNIAIDASTEIHRAANSANTMGLTDNDGNPSMHINTFLLGTILKLHKTGVHQYWVFDHRQSPNKQDFHIKLKEIELQKRRARRTKAQEKLVKLEQELKEKEELFSSSDEENNEGVQLLRDEIKKTKKQSFCLKQFYTDDLIFVLNMLQIPWIVAPEGYEAEQICAMASRYENIIGVKIDYILSPDVDSLLFGAPNLLKKNFRGKSKKDYLAFNLEKILLENNITREDLIKIGVILKCDFAEKTKGVGPKTVLKKFSTIELMDDQKAAVEYFLKEPTEEEINGIIVENEQVLPFQDEVLYKKMLDWLQLSKCYNRTRITNAFKKAGLFLGIN